jgi:beta-lactamase regulating signal transducer with metallopeptidase domain
MTNAMNTVLAALGTSAIRSLLLAAVAGLALKIFRAKSTAVRLFVWRTVLGASLAMPFLGQLLPPLRIPTPRLTQAATAVWATKPIQNRATIASAFNRSLTERIPADVSDTQPYSAASPRPDATVPSSLAFHFGWSSIGWNVWASVIYLSITFVLLMRYVLGIAMSRRLIRRSHEICDPHLCATIRNLQSDARIAESELISVPVTIGVFRAAILLPTCWREWDDSQLNAVIAHEASHVARLDALMQHFSILHRAIFWFSPLAWWLDRRLAALSEQASDEAALAGGADRNDYARTLLHFFEAVQAAPGRVWWQGVSMAQHGQAEERVEKVLAWKGAISMNLKKSFAIVIIVLAVPAVYLVASARPSFHPAQEAQSTAASSPQNPAPPSTVPEMPAPPVNGVVNTGPAPVASVAPEMPEAPVSSYADQSHDGGYSYSYGYNDDDERFIIVSGKSDSYTMSGSRQDIRHVERLKKQLPGDFIWFQRDEKSYIIRDQATVDRARSWWAPQEELGKQQEALGKQQEALGKKQEALGKKMEEVRVNVPDMTAALDALKAKLQKLGPTATMEQIGDLQSEIGELQSKMGEIQSRAGEQQGKLGEEQGKLGEEQGKLGEQQGELGRRQGELAREASIKMKGLLDDAIKNGKAQPERSGLQGASL